MARSLFRGAPELSRLFIESPIHLISEFLSHSQFSVFLSDAMAAVPADAEDQIRSETMAEALKALKSDRINLIEIEARRVMLMTDKTPDAMLRRLAEDPRFAAKEGLKAQRDAVARSLWAYLYAIALFEAAERAMQVRVLATRLRQVADAFQHTPGFEEIVAQLSLSGIPFALDVRLVPSEDVELKDAFSPAPVHMLDPEADLPARTEAPARPCRTKILTPLSRSVRVVGFSNSDAPSVPPNTGSPS